MAQETCVRRASRLEAPVAVGWAQCSRESGANQSGEKENANESTRWHSSVYNHQRRRDSTRKVDRNSALVIYRVLSRASARRHSTEFVAASRRVRPL